MTVVPLALLAGTFIMVGGMLTRPVTNADTYFHLRLGREFLDGWNARAPESVSRFATADWVPTQWLGQVALASAEGAFGLPGVVAVTSLTILLMTVALFVAARRQGPLVIAAALVPIALFACAPSLSGRPQVVSYALTALVTSAWLGVRRTGRVPWWTVAATWVWAMCHGMWPVAAVVALAAAGGLALERPSPRPRLWKLAAVPALSLVAAGLTPVGPALYGAVVRVGAISEYFSEWRPPDFTSPAPFVAASLLVLMLATGLRMTAPMPWTVLALTLLAGVFLLHSGRTVPVAVAMLVPLLAHHLSGVLPRRERSAAEVPVVVGAVVVAGALAVLLSAGNHEDLRQRSDAHASVDALPAGTPLLNEWGEGGYDMWRHRDLEILQHGYGDMFTDSELQRNVKINKLAPGWEHRVRELGFEHALLYRENPVAHTLVDHLGWTVVDEDPKPAGHALGDPGKRLVHLRAPEGWLDPSP